MTRPSYPPSGILDVFRLVRLSLVLALVAVVLPSTPTDARTAATFPQFAPGTAVLDHGQLRYDPTGEFSFPSVIRAAEHFDEPLAEYYLYTAPHDNPGGISLFHADALTGPWTEHEANPIVARDWQPHFSVSHVASPEAFWVADEERLFLYFHGENGTTRFATSTDGIEFEYGGVAITAGDAGAGVTEAAYARISEHTVPALGNRYVMTFMDALADVRRIRWAVSDDARTWSVQPRPLVHPRGAEGRNISSAVHLHWQGEHYVAYHGSAGNVYLTEVGADFAEERHLGVLFAASRTGPDDRRSAAPYLVADGPVLHMFYEAGQRSRTTIAHTSADLDRLGPLVQPHYEFGDVVPASTHFHDIHALAAAELTAGCGSLAVYCPTRSVTRAEMATFLARTLDLRTGSTSRFRDVKDGSTHAGAIEAIAKAGLTNGCGGDDFCPKRVVTRAEMASFLQRAVGLPLGSTKTQFHDVVPGSTHAAAIDAIARARITNGCGRTTRYCPHRDVTRAEMASFLVRAFDP